MKLIGTRDAEERLRWRWMIGCDHLWREQTRGDEEGERSGRRKRSAEEKVRGEVKDPRRRWSVSQTLVSPRLVVLRGDTSPDELFSCWLSDVRRDSPSFSLKVRAPLDGKCSVGQTRRGPKKEKEKKGHRPLKSHWDPPPPPHLTPLSWPWSIRSRSSKMMLQEGRGEGFYEVTSTGSFGFL